MKLTAEQKKKFLAIKGAKELMERYKQRGMGKKRRKGQRGGDFWSDVGNWFVQAGEDVNNWLKDTKIISTASDIASYVAPFVGFPEATPIFEGISSGAKALGYGKKRKMRGGSQLTTPLPLANPVFARNGTYQYTGFPPKMLLQGGGFWGDASKAFLGFNDEDIKKMDTKAVANLATAYKNLQSKPKMKGLGGAPFGSISSEFGKVSF